MRKCLQIQIVSGQIISRSVCRTNYFRGLHGGFDHTRNAGCHLVLKLEDVLKRSFESISPKIRASESVDQVSGNAYSLARLSNRTLQHVPDAEFTTDLLHIDCLALVGERAVARDHEQPADAAERGDDLLDHSVSEVLLFRVTTHIGEGSTAIDGLSGRDRTGAASIGLTVDRRFIPSTRTR